MAAPTTDVVKVEELRQTLRIEGETQSQNLARLATAVTKQLEERLQTAFVQQSFVEYREGSRKRFYPAQCPVVSVTSIVDPAGNTVPSTEYLVRQKRWIEHMGVFPIAYATNNQPTDWTITYVAGWFATQADVTATIKAEVIRAIGILLTTAAGGVAGPVTMTKVGDLEVRYSDAALQRIGSMGAFVAGSPALAAATEALFMYRGAYL